MRQVVFNTKVFTDVLSGEKPFVEGKWKAAGVAVPVFSLKSDNNFGTGEFNDLKLLADWCHKVGLKMIQILPINDTRTDGSWSNSYPYKAISTKALHPIYLNLTSMGTLYDEGDKEYFEKQRRLLNSKDFVDYPEVMKIKNLFFEKLFSQSWHETKNRFDYIKFFRENEEWLVPYSAFCFLCSHYQTSDFSLWEDYSVFDKKKIERLAQNDKCREKIEFHYFLQYHLDKQLKDAVRYLHEQGVALKGDIPIGIGRHSVEAWTSPELFNLNAQAGAPPDSFAIEGQNWGFPTYNWEVMAKDNYKWWRERLTQMSRYFDAYRIDHILGFFRIWEIPYSNTQGLMGYFSPDKSLELHLDKNQIDRYTKPYIRGHFLNEIFDIFTDEVREKYLIETSFSYFELKPEFDTQRKITDYFSKNHLDNPEKEGKIKKGLLSLCAEVIFLKDDKKENSYRPRIALQFTHSYNELSNEEKDYINRLYDDYFYHRNEELWKEEAMKKLPQLLDSSNMMVCGEDLGMVPRCVPEVMQQLGILSLEVQRMPKNPSETFVNPQRNNYLSVDTTSTHDTSTLRGWWEENGETTNRFYREMLGHQEGAPFFAEPYVCQEIIKQHLDSSSMWVILPIQDFIAMDGEYRWDQTQREQINVPADPDNHWCYKMHQSLESLNEKQDFNNMLSAMIKKSGRNL